MIAAPALGVVLLIVSIPPARATAEACLVLAPIAPASFRFADGLERTRPRGCASSLELEPERLRLSRRSIER
jgi:hypothetical protein